MVFSVYFCDARRSPRNAAVTLTYNSVNCKYPCHKCLIENDELNTTRLNGDEIVLKTPENMKDYVNRVLQINIPYII